MGWGVRRGTRAYVTVLSSDHYLTGLIALAFSLRVSRARYPLYVLVGSKVGDSTRQELERFGLMTMEASKIDIPPEIISANLSSDYHKHWAGVFEKLLIFSLDQFQKIVFLDSDMLVLRNVDELFNEPHMAGVNADISQAASQRSILNAGLMVIEPRPGLTDQLLQTLPAVFESEKLWRAAAGRPVSMGVQSLINAFWPNWHDDTHLHLHPKYNVLVSGIDDYVRHRSYPCFGRDGIRVLHFIGESKPWMGTRRELANRLGRLLIRRRFLECAATILYCASWTCARAVPRFVGIIGSRRRAGACGALVR